MVPFFADTTPMNTNSITARQTVGRPACRVNVYPAWQRTLVLTGLIAALFAPPAFADEAADVSRLLRNGQYAEALGKADAFLGKNPRDAQMRFLKGVILTEQNKPAEAIAIFTKLTADFPALPEPYNNLAVLYAANGQYDKARSALDAAIRTNPTYATAYENLGDVHAKLASQAYDKALQLDSGNAGAKSKLTLVRSLVSNMNGNVNPKYTPPPPDIAETRPAPSAPAVAPTAQAAPAAPMPKIAAAPSAITTSPAPNASSVTIAPAPAPAPEKTAPAKPAPAAKETPPKESRQEQQRQEAKAKEQEAKAREQEAKAKEHEAKMKAANAEREDVANIVNGWARAWSAQDVKAYLGYYGGDFQPPGNQSRKAWEEERRSRISGKGRISVKVEALQVSVEGNTATARFRQVYVSDQLTANTRKTLVLTQRNNKWQIKQERTGN